MFQLPPMPKHMRLRLKQILASYADACCREMEDLCDLDYLPGKKTQAVLDVIRYRAQLIEFVEYVRQYPNGKRPGNVPNEEGQMV